MVAGNMKFDKSDLLYMDKYSWNSETEDSNKKTWFSDNKVFNKNDGYQVLNLINSFNFVRLDGFNKAEKMIFNYLPEDHKYDRYVKKWLCINWINF